MQLSILVTLLHVTGDGILNWAGQRLFAGENQVDSRFGNRVLLSGQDLLTGSFGRTIDESSEARAFIISGSTLSNGPNTGRQASTY